MLLDPFGLTPTHLQRALGEIMSHGVDDADLNLPTTRSESWSLKEGIVKSGSFSIDPGVGARGQRQKIAFAYSDDLPWDSLIDAAHAVVVAPPCINGAKLTADARAKLEKHPK